MPELYKLTHSRPQCLRIWESVSVKRRLWTADCRPGVKCRLCVICRLQTQSKMQVGVKCRPSINCSRGRLKGKTIPQIHVNEDLLDICFHKSIPLFSGTSSRPENILVIAILNLFSVRETSRLNFSIRVIDFCTLC